MDLIYDCEIVNAIAGPKDRVHGITYCDGWDDKANMGISVICAYSYLFEEYTVWFGSDLMDFIAYMNLHTRLIGFNHIKFDNELLMAVSRSYGLDSDLVHKSIANLYHFDILREAYIAYEIDAYPVIFTKLHKGFKLDNFSLSNFRARKTGDGALAPVLWQQGKKSEVVNYCLNDVKLTKRLYDRILNDGFLLHPVDMEAVIRFNPVRMNLWEGARNPTSDLVRGKLTPEGFIAKTW